MTSAALLRELVLIELGVWSAVAIHLADSALVVLGHACTANGCANIATWRAFWPGSTCAVCVLHRDALARIADVFAFELASQVLEVRPHPNLDPSAVRFAAMELF